ncbi:hypothetical protein SPRG_01809 [Saprolegnia parasitica CBS 223.65]|uniref:LNR domain-containing protein n=1 Tax=Saprolegnia parasitica (strain CBS 223.65) TaxID=695850 RepID=A0A067CXD8_SAPPC|nr:hypothetical protein SPRG_01809 [Saprolegnia parasitica CBS 223.65]KDO33930.1 hypothetical protein SPRG_01809 [Saprolegnia parasitica CBS 223.65]|eukprot:XP_012195564.1 hypothetical protein SPRG_01809 [Saprolegnia parasitica CBS 223.65]
MHRPDLGKLAVFFGTSDADWTQSGRQFLLGVAYTQAILGFTNFLFAGVILWSFTDGDAKLVDATSPKTTAIVFWLLALCYAYALWPSSGGSRVFVSSSPTVKHLPAMRRLAAIRPSPNVELGMSHTVVIMCQTYLAQLMASTLTQGGVATTYGAMVVLNATVTPIFLFTKSARSKRLLLDLLDAFLSFTLTIGISLVMFLLPLFRHQFFSTWGTNHPCEWYASYLGAIRIFLVMPPLQLASTVVPNLVVVLSLCQTLSTLRTMPIKLPSLRTTVSPSSRLSISRATKSGPEVCRASASLSSLVHSASGEWRKRFTFDQANMRFVVTIFFLNVAWGLAVLGLLLHAVYVPRTCPSYCVASSLPWFDDGCSCIYARLQCAVDNATVDVDSFLTAHALGTNVLILKTVGCRAPPLRHVMSFPRLFRLDIEFSNMTSWDVRQLPPSLRMLILRYSNLSSIPPALQAPGDALRVLHFIGSPVGDVPGPVWANWTQLTTLWLSDTQMSRIPDAIADLTSLEDLVLSANRITSLPPSLLQLATLRRLALDSNPIATFPQALLEAKPKLELALDHTQISAVPDSTVVRAAIASGAVQLHATPFCATAVGASFASGACSPTCSSTCSVFHWRDDFCDPLCYSPSCAFDGGDCPMV